MATELAKKAKAQFDSKELYHSITLKELGKLAAFWANVSGILGKKVKNANKG